MFCVTFPALAFSYLFNALGGSHLPIIRVNELAGFNVPPTQNGYTETV